MKILIVQIGRFGDMVLMTPMFRAIHERHPDAEIHVLAGRKNAELLEGHPRVKKILVFEKQPLKLLRLLLRLRQERYDYWIDPKDHYSSESALLARLSGSKKSIGFNRPGSNSFDISTPSQEENAAFHIVERNLQALYPLGIIHDNLRPELFVDEQAFNYVQKCIQSGEKYVVVNLSAGQQFRIWPVEQWMEILPTLASSCLCVLSFAPSDEEDARKIQAALPCVRLFPSRSIFDAIALVQGAILVITPDTSIVHIASAFNKPLIGLYPNIPSNFIKFRPLSTDAIVCMPKREGEGVGSIDSLQVKTAINEMMLRLPVK